MDARVTKPVYLRINARERRALEALADHEGRKLGETIREAIREAALRRGLWPEIPGMELEETYEE